MSLRYLDTSSGDLDDCLGRWLERVIVRDLRAFRCQSGYFAASAIKSQLPILAEVARDGVVRFVLGANIPDQPSAEDIKLLLPLVRDAERTSIAIVACQGALFHPKVIHVVDAAGRASAYIGSANLTERGCGVNVEAGILLESGEPQADAALVRIADRIDAWARRSEAGIYHVRREEDVASFLATGLLIREAERQVRRAAARDMEAREGVAKFRPAALWRPRRLRGLAGHQEGDEEGGDQLPTAASPVEALKWCKKLSGSDAQHPREGRERTNVTGKLRLSQAGFAIDHRTFFRQSFFRSQRWVTTSRLGKPVEECHAVFRVTWHGTDLGEQTLLVDHAAHREAGQNNVATVLSWGQDLGTRLRNSNQVGNWVVLERDEQGRFALRIQSEAPDWAPA